MPLMSSSETDDKNEGIFDMEVPMETILAGIEENIDVRPELVKRAIRDGYAEWVKYVVLTADGHQLLERQ